MKRNILFAISAILIVGCNSGMNKSILETMDVSDLKKNIEADSTFTDFYKDVQDYRTWVLKSDVRQAKYGEITYKRIKKFDEKINDTTFVNKLYKAQHESYDVLFPDYSVEVDSIMQYWKQYESQYSLDSLVTVEYSKLWKEYYSYSGEVKNVNIGFLVTPLKGTIQQLIFRYCIKSKISNDGSMSVWDSHRCLASSPISHAQTLYWEADYSDEKYLKNMSSESVERDFDFNIRIVEVRIDGENMSEKLDIIPKYVKYALDNKDMDGGIWKDEIITENINKDYISFWTYAMPKINEEIRKVDPLVYDLLKEIEAEEDE